MYRISTIRSTYTKFAALQRFLIPALDAESACSIPKNVRFSLVVFYSLFSVIIVLKIDRPYAALFGHIIFI